ncbi:hypothetical protein [Streptomyces sp. NPDC050535]|uniref:hypothetical protein n=1 Tax=Streptomyces sp. NPDC050535 TaxID=3365626 RepID=UPI00379A04AA
MRYGNKVPLVYARVALRDWHAFATARVSRVSTSSMFLSSFGLPTVTETDDFTMPHRPEVPTVVSLSTTPNSPGLICREQHKAGRRTLIPMAFEDFECEIRDSMARSLGAFGFDPAEAVPARVPATVRQGPPADRPHRPRELGRGGLQLHARGLRRGFPRGRVSPVGTRIA